MRRSGALAERGGEAVSAGRVRGRTDEWPVEEAGAPTRGQAATGATGETETGNPPPHSPGASARGWASSRHAMSTESGDGVVLVEATSVPPGGPSGSGAGAAPTAPVAVAARAGSRGSPSMEVAEEHLAKVGEARGADDETSATVGDVGLEGRPRATVEPGATRETPPFPPGRPSGQGEGTESRHPDPRPPRGRPPPRTVGSTP
eukprot:scaffold13655_cov114-Isochrysis_galbana.AAC.1